MLGRSELAIDFVEGEAVRDLIDRMIAEYGDAFAALAASEVRMAIDSTLVALEQSLRPGSEVAFFPPVTGG